MTSREQNEFEFDDLLGKDSPSLYSTGKKNATVESV
jgi:hypothetical protein